MGDNTKADRPLLDEGSSVEATHTEDVFVFMPVGTGQALRVKVLIEVHCEDKLEDTRANMLIDLEEALLKTMVGHYRLLKKSHLKEYKGTVRFSRYGFMEES